MSNLPLRFNDKFYENAVISKNGNIFRRSVMCKKSRAFSSRAIFLNEIVQFKIKETSAGWRGPFRIGVIYDDPGNFQATLTKKNDEYNPPSPPNLFLNKVQEGYYRPQNVFSFVVDGNGTMLFDVNGVGDWEVFLADIDVTKELWLVFEVMGVIWSLEFAEPHSSIAVTCSETVTDVSSSTISLVPHTLNESSAGEIKVNLNEKDESKEKSNLRISSKESRKRDNSPVGGCKEQRFNDVNKKYDNDERLCAICLDQEKNAVFTPCNHFCACYSCAFNTWQLNKKCPICQSFIKEVIKIYHS